MIVRDLLELLTEHAADGRLLNDAVLVRVDGTLRKVSSSYVDGTLILVAGMPVD